MMPECKNTYFDHTKEAMKIPVVLLFSMLFLLQIQASGRKTPWSGGTACCFRSDSIIDGTGDTAFEAVIKSRALPAKEQVRYFSEITRYGFKNLFTASAYNSALPYNAQVNPHAEPFIHDYMQKHTRYLSEMRQWGLPYFNLIDQIFNQYGLPRELKYVAVIESNLSAGATSIKGAAGPWQFMPQTAREYGMEVSAFRDERRDYVKSTHAASRLLLHLYRQYRDWLLVMAAYNGGPGRVDAAIRRSGSRDFWKLQYHLPEESRTYVKRFIATHYIMEGSGSIPAPPTGVRPSGSQGTNEVRQVEMLPLSGKYNSLVIAKNLSMEIAEFNRLNPGFDAALSGEGRYELRLPPEKMQLFLVNRYAILNECVQLLLGGTVMPEKTGGEKPANKVKS
jgi:membrane-bound lytic murein transglycosylase D